MTKDEPDIVVEGRAEPLSDADAVRRITEQFKQEELPRPSRWTFGN